MQAARKRTRRHAVRVNVEEERTPHAWGPAPPPVRSQPIPFNPARTGGDRA